MKDLLSKLRGGDRRSIGKVDEVVAVVEKEAAQFKYLVSGLFDPDPIVRMRAADAMEKEGTCVGTSDGEADGVNDGACEGITEG